MSKYTLMSKNKEGLPETVVVEHSLEYLDSIISHYFGEGDDFIVIRASEVDMFANLSMEILSRSNYVSVDRLVEKSMGRDTLRTIANSLSKSMRLDEDTDDDVL